MLLFAAILFALALFVTAVEVNNVALVLADKMGHTLFFTEILLAVLWAAFFYVYHLLP